MPDKSNPWTLADEKQAEAYAEAVEREDEEMDVAPDALTAMDAAEAIAEARYKAECERDNQALLHDSPAEEADTPGHAFGAGRSR